MQKIGKLTLKNFKFFLGEVSINFDRKNVLLYGENGSGKSSIYWALYTFLQSVFKNDPLQIRKYFDPGHDENLINEIESTLKRFRFYDIRKSSLANNKVNYTPLAAAPELENMFKENFKDEETRINSFLLKFKKSTWDQCEIVSTLYAAWNNRIIQRQPITDDLLKIDFLNWDKQKKKYKDRLDGALEWMRSNDIIPDGYGKVINKAN